VNIETPAKTRQDVMWGYVARTPPQHLRQAFLTRWFRVIVQTHHYCQITSHRQYGNSCNWQSDNPKTTALIRRSCCSIQKLHNKLMLAGSCTAWKWTHFESTCHAALRWSPL